MNKHPLSRFKNIHADRKRCFILGNGPSLKKQNLAALHDEIVFVTNWFVVHEAFADIAPDYICMSNPKFWTGGLCKGMADVINATPDLGLFFEHTYPVRNQEFPMVDQDRINAVTLNYGKTVFDGHVSFDITKETYHGHTVIIDLCIPVAHFMGFEEIYLLGCDCDYGLQEASDYSQCYFYEIDEQEVPPDPIDYLQNEWEQNVLASYAVMRKAFEKDRRAIYNATAGGKLEVFPRVDLDRVLKGESRPRAKASRTD